MKLYTRAQEPKFQGLSFNQLSRLFMQQGEVDLYSGLQTTMISETSGMIAKTCRLYMAIG